MIAHPGPPQIRTCATSASGSSPHGFAADGIPSNQDAVAHPSLEGLTSFAIRCCFVDTRSSAGALGMLPFNGSMRWHRLPSTGSPTGGIPPLQQYYSMLRLPAALRCLRLAVPALCLFSIRATPSTRVAGLGLKGSGGPVRIMETGDDRISHVPGEPRRAHALLCDPGGIERARPITAARCCLPYRVRTTSAPTNSPLSRLNHTAYALAVYASQCGSPQHHARLASGCRSALPGRIGYLPGSCERFHARWSSIVRDPCRTPPFPGFPWRTSGRPG